MNLATSSSDSIAILVAAFNNLDTCELRREAIRCLFANLSYKELNELMELRRCNKLRFDPLLKLANELVIQILQTLDLRTIFRCRLVSREWAAVILSREFMHSILGPWFSAEDSPMCIESPQASPSILIARIDAFRSGRPFSVMTVYRNPGGHENSSSKDELVAYQKRIVAWCDTTTFETNLLCLDTGRSRSWVFENRAKPMLITVSEVLLATCDYHANVSIFNHLSKASYTFKLTSSDIRHFNLSLSTLIVLNGDYITIWSLESQFTTTISIHVGINSFSRCLTISIIGQELNVAHYASKNGTVSFTKIPLQEPRPDDTSIWRTQRHELSSREDCLPGQLRPSEAYEFFDIGIVRGVGKRMLIGLDGSEHPPKSVVLGNAERHPQGYYCKGVFYKSHIIQRRGCERERRLAVADCHDGGIEGWQDTEMTAPPLSKTGTAETAGYSPRSITTTVQVLGDDNFLVHSFPDRLLVYSFHKDLDMFYAGAHLVRRLR